MANTDTLVEVRGSTMSPEISTLSLLAIQGGVFGRMAEAGDHPPCLAADLHFVELLAIGDTAPESPARGSRSSSCGCAAFRATPRSVTPCRAKCRAAPSPPAFEPSPAAMTRACMYSPSVIHSAHVPALLVAARADPVREADVIRMAMRDDHAQHRQAVQARMSNTCSQFGL